VRPAFPQVDRARLVDATLAVPGNARRSATFEAAMSFRAGRGLTQKKKEKKKRPATPVGKPARITGRRWAKSSGGKPAALVAKTLPLRL